jgi:lysozyme family protein
MASFDPIFNLTLNHEGGFQKFPNDSANYVKGKLIGTNRGISASAYYTYYKKIPTEQDMRNLTKQQAYQIYKANYWNKINGDRINNQSVAELMFQYIIGSGPAQLSDLKDIANAVAGKKLIASVDRTFTDQEIDIINKLPAQKYWEALKAWRHAYFIRLVKAKPKLAQFLKGWQRRLNSYKFVPSQTDTESNNSGGIFFLMVTGLTIALMAKGYNNNKNKKNEKI